MTKTIIYGLNKDAVCPKCASEKTKTTYQCKTVFYKECKQCDAEWEIHEERIELESSKKALEKLRDWIPEIEDPFNEGRNWNMKISADVIGEYLQRYGKHIPLKIRVRKNRTTYLAQTELYVTDLLKLAKYGYEKLLEENRIEI